ncbi:M20 peptidase aminoacylase family protein [Bacillus tianshenii]|nr:M20 peptidase aminoacylase family protein [Bacillus tianshenii]
MNQVLESLKPTLQQTFQYLHENPEISWQEVGTTKYLVDFLSAQGFEPVLFEDCPGFYIEIGEGPFCVGLRTDMDALWQEVNGTLQANHSCGHDAHMTMAVMTLLLLKELDYQPNGRLKVLFQPAEEKGEGALKLVEKGLIDDIDFLYGVHLRPIQELQDGHASAGIQHGAANVLRGKIFGQDAHAARPHLGTNAIEIGAAIMNHLNMIHLDPMVPHSVKMTSFQAGGEIGNSIPGSGTFLLDLRAQTNEVMQDLKSAVQKTVQKVSELYNVDITLSGNDGVAAAVIDSEAQQVMAEAVEDTIGKDRLMPPIVTAGGEDFHFYTLKRPSLKAVMLGLGCDLKPGLHHPNMTFNEEALSTGVEILAKTIMNTFRTYG